MKFNQRCDKCDRKVTRYLGFGKYYCIYCEKEVLDLDFRN